MFKAPKGRWEILPVWRAAAEDRRYDFLDLYSIEEFLRWHMFDFGVMVKLRELFAPQDVGRFTDDEVIAAVTWKLANKELVLTGGVKKDIAPPDGGGGDDKKKGKKAPAPPPGPPVKPAPPPGNLQVTVLDDKGKGVPNVEITGPGTKKTDASGVVLFTGLAPGKYTATVTTPLPAAIKDDLFIAPAKAHQDAQVPSGGTAALTFHLKLRPFPLISTPEPKIVVVKHTYHGKPKPGVKPHRIPVKLSFEGDHDGDGEFNSNHAGNIVVFEKADDPEAKAKALPFTIKAAQLKNKTVFVEGKAASAAMQDTELTLTLKNGSIPPNPKKNPAKEKITCVLLQLDIFTWRDENDSAPVKIAEGPKIDTGRAVHIQGTTAPKMFAQRAKMVLSKALPKDYAKKLVLKPITGGVQAFDAGKEKPAAGQAALTGDALHLPNGPINAANGTTFWVEGQTLSTKMHDTGWTVELEELPGKEGDRVTMSVVKTELRLFKPKKDGAANPDIIPGDDKLTKGRFVHLQDGKRHRGQSIIRKVLPADFTGKVFLTDWDIKAAPHSETKSGAPKVSLFDAATAGGAIAFSSDIPQAAGAPDDLKKFFIEGKTVSTELIDTQIRLGIRDVDPGCDRESVTVYQVVKVDVKLRGTPCKRGANAVAAMAAGAAKNAAIAADAMRANTMPAKSFNTDSLVFGATAITVVRECGDLKMTATVKPAVVTLAWDIAQASDDAVKSAKPTHAADGDDKKHKVTADKTGSFNVFAFVDGNGDSKHAVEEDGVTVNLNMVEIKIPAGAANNQIVTHPSFSNARSGGGSLVVDSAVSQGIAPAPGYRDAAFVNQLIAFKMTAQLLGGGADRRRGVPSITLGFIQQTTADSVKGTYADGKTEIENIFASPIPAATVTAGAPATLGFPVRDTRGAGNAGAAAFIISSQDDEQSNLAAGGQQRICRFIDPPAIIIDLVHPVSGAALASISGSNDFEDFFVAVSSDYNENFTVIGHATWQVFYGTFAVPGGWTNAGASVAPSGAKMTVFSPAVTGESQNMERCPPNFVDNLVMDAR